MTTSFCPSQSIPADFEEPNQIINEKLCDGTILKGYGKPGHGMNGKDADIDRIGQCLVTSLVTEDPTGADSMCVKIHLRLYASICAPSYDSLEDYQMSLTDETKAFLGEDVNDDDKLLEYLRSQAETIVCGMDPGAGFEWDGDGAWDGGVDVVLEVPLSLDEYEEIDCGEAVALETLGTIAERINKEICDANQGGTPARDAVKRFEDEVGMANDMINNIA